MKRMLCALFIMSVIAVSARAANSSVEGLWEGQLQSDSGTQSIRMTLVPIEGTLVGGAIVTDGGGEIGIRNGSVDGSSLTFVTYQGNLSTATKFDWTGVINGDEISLSCTSDDPQAQRVQFVVHRQQ
jgi:hypothetical protein